MVIFKYFKGAKATLSSALYHAQQGTSRFYAQRI